MKILQKKFSAKEGWVIVKDPGPFVVEYNLVFVFGSAQLLSSNTYDEVRSAFPNAEILINTTAGEIIDIQVNDDTLSLTAIKFDRAYIKTAAVDIADFKDSREAGAGLAIKLTTENLRSVFVISDGQQVNGSGLAEGIQESLPDSTMISGGLAGDAARFQHTLVGLNEVPREGRIVMVGFYGAHLRVTNGTVGGWDPFGSEKLITKSTDNILYELDGKPALEIYKNYLGMYAEELPSSGLFFPLSIRTKGARRRVVRTILSVNEKDNSLVFAGNMPEGSYAQLMKANADRLIEGASTAALISLATLSYKPELAILISCVGRKLVLDQRVEEEVEVVRETYGPDTAITGFYSYGEISSAFNFMTCELHNQTMTITTFRED